MPSFNGLSMFVLPREGGSFFVQPVIVVDHLIGAAEAEAGRREDQQRHEIEDIVEGAKHWPIEQGMMQELLTGRIRLV